MAHGPLTWNGLALVGGVDLHVDPLPTPSKTAPYQSREAGGTGPNSKQPRPPLRAASSRLASNLAPDPYLPRNPIQ